MFAGERNCCLYIQVVSCLLCSPHFVWRNSWCGRWAVDLEPKVCLWCTPPKRGVRCLHWATERTLLIGYEMSRCTWLFPPASTPATCLSTQLYYSPRGWSYSLQYRNGMPYKVLESASNDRAFWKLRLIQKSRDFHPHVSVAIITCAYQASKTHKNRFFLFLRQGRKANTIAHLGRSWPKTGESSANSAFWRHKILDFLEASQHKLIKFLPALLN